MPTQKSTSTSSDTKAQSKTTKSQASAKTTKSQASAKAAVNAVNAVDASKQEGAVDTKEKSKRTFKIVGADGIASSRFTGSTPKQAADKALTQLYRRAVDAGTANESGVHEIDFTIKETTRGSKGKEFNYHGKREELKEPKQYTIKSGDKERVITIRNEFTTRVNRSKNATASE